MFFVNNISGDDVYVTDTADSAVDKYTKEDLKQIMIQNPDLSIKGVDTSDLDIDLESLKEAE